MKGRNMTYNTVLFDLDDTLTDFSSSEYVALEEAMAKHKLTLTEEMFTMYRMINRELWDNLEKGVFTKKEILSLRFDLLFTQAGLQGDASQLNHDYLISMGRHAKKVDGAVEVLDALASAGVRVAMVTNGAEMAQKIKLAVTGLDAYFEDIYISDVTGSAKPDIKFFEFVEKAMGGINKEKTMIVGDSLGSDILGGVNFGISTCWYNPHHAENNTDIEPDYEIDGIGGLLMVLGLD